MSKFLVICLSILIDGHSGFAMERTFQNQQKEDEKLQKKIAEFDTQYCDEGLPDELQCSIASFSIADFLQDTEKELRERLLLEDSLYGCIERAEISYNDKFLFTVAAQTSNSACIWDMTTGQLLHILDGHDESINIIKISPNDKYLITHSIDNIIKIWNIPTGQPEHTLSTSGVHLIVISPDNTQMVTASTKKEGENLVQIWSMKTGQLLSVLERDDGHCVAAVTITCGDKKQLITASCDGSLKLWDMQTGKLVRTFMTQEIFLSSHYMIITPDNNYLITGCHVGIYVWDINTGKSWPAFERIGNKSIKFLFMSLDNTKLVFMTEDGVIEVGNITGEWLYTYDSRQAGGFSLPCIFDRRGKKFLKASHDSGVKVYDIETGTLLYDLQEQDRGGINILETNSDGTQVVTCSSGNNAKIWSLKKSPARLWLEKDILPFQANLIARAYAAKKADELFEIRLGTDYMFIWFSLPNYVRNYLRLYLNIALTSEPAQIGQ